MGPVGPGLDNANHVGQDDQGVVEAAVLLRIKAGDEAGRRAAGQLKGDGESAVPEAGMLGAEVAYVGAVLKERLEGLRRQAVGEGYVFAVSVALDVFVEAAEEAEGHYFADGPDRGAEHLVSLPIVSDEVFVAAVQFFVQAAEGVGVAFGVSEDRDVFVGLGAVSVGEYVGPAGANGDFDPLDSFADELAEGAVKVVKVPEVVESGVGEELVGIALNGDREAVGRKAVVIVVLEAVQGAGLVGNDQAAALEDCELLRVGFGGLVAAHARPPEKSNAPIWALLRGLARIVDRRIGVHDVWVNDEK
jgi:hypothetical protein